MINVTDTIKQAYEKSTTQYDKIVLDNNEYVISNVEPDDDCYKNGNIFGTAIAKALSFEIDNSVDLEGKEFKYYTGIKTTTGIEWINLGTFITQDVEPNDTTNVNKVNAMDYMLKSNITYESDLDYESGTITMLQVLQEACQKAGLELATTDFANADFIVDSNQFEQGTLIRQVIQAVAQMSGTVAKIRSNDKLYLITPKTTGTVRKVFKLSDYSEAEIKRATHPINLVSLGMADVEGENVVMRDEASIEENGENSLIFNDNPFAYTEAKRQQLITAIFNAVKGFEYKAFTLKGQWLPYLETLDNIQVKDTEGNTYNSFLFRCYAKSPKGLETEMSAPSVTIATVKYQNVATALQIAKRTEFKVDKQNQQIQALVTTNSELVKKTTQLEIDVDTIKGEISEVADLTITSDGYGSINVENINESEPILIRIYPGAEDIIPLRPRMGLYPRIGLYPHRRELIIMRTNDDETPYSLEYNIPGDLYRLDNNYDEFVIDYENQKCYINRNIGINEAGEKYLLEIPTVENYEYPTLQLLEGDYKIYMPAFENAYIYVRLMTKNIYTSHFATKIEMNSKIEETVDSIDLSVNQKLSNYSTTQEMNTSIDIKANEIEASVQQEISTITGENSIRNGTFENGLQNWNTFASQGDVQVTEYNNKKYAELITMNGETKLTQTIIGLIEEIDYKLSFKVFNKSFIPTGTTFTVKIWQTKNNSEELILLKSQEVELNGTEKHINIEFNMLYAGDVDIEFGLNISSFSSEEISAMVTDVVVAGGSISERFASLKLGLDGIESEVSKKVGDNEVISKINQSSEAVGINANRIELSANDILELLAGNTINISGRNIKISSNNFNVNENGIMTCNQAVLNNVTINSGNLNMQGNNSTPTIAIKDNEGEVELYTNNFNMTYYYPGAGANVSQFLQKSGYLVECNGTSTSVEYFGITTPKLTQTSLAEEKKNFEKMKNCALDIIKMIDIYKYNLKSEKDTDKKHIGFVIGDNYKYSKEVTSTDNKGVDNYSFTSLCCKAIQEQQEQIEELKKEIEKLKGE